jgi:benzoyl-CoA reductase/2-hydroxyglutaryl-CoA dehydratase subunit BcrC/BadD/HgdB
MKKIIISLSFVLAVSMLHAQTATDSVKATINKLFKAMKNADAGNLISCFDDIAVMRTIVNKLGTTVAVEETVEEFAKQISTMPKDSADERIVFESIKIDGPMATVWAPYKFYYNGKFSHCGVNHFVLVRTNDEWRIHYCIDTRRREGCE